MNSEMRELVRAKIHEWRTDALEIRESDHAHRNLIAEEYEARADELEAMLTKKPAPISGGAVITDAMVSAAYDHLCEAGVIEDAGTVAADMKVMRQALERALLARTEAGADGAIYQMMATDEDVDEDGNVRPDDPRMWMDHSREEYERLNNHPSVRSRIVYTHPQDASGDAERTKALLLALIQIRDSTYRNATQLRGMANDALERDRTRPVTAMQAKEAK